MQSPGSHKKILDYNRDRSCFISFAGPSGSGKTTVVKSFGGRIPTFIERTAGNPHLADLLAGNPQFDAFRNQRWFLEQIVGALENAESRQSLVMDQAPSAVLDVYTKMFHDAGEISPRGMDVLREMLAKIESRISNWEGGHHILLLDASAEVLYSRATARATGSPVPPPSWYREVRDRFADAFRDKPAVTRLDTTSLGIEEVQAAAEKFINSVLSSPGELQR